MEKNRKKGFTLIELIVVLVILAIITAIAVPFFQNYWKRAEFRKNESNAKTVYLAAESKLTYYRSSGQWETFKKQIQSQGIQAEREIVSGNDQIYAITLDANSYQKAKEDGNAVLKLLDDYSYDKEFLDAAIAIEIDLSSGEVYSAFYGTKCKGLNYAESDTDGYLTMLDREYSSRSKRLLGYYSAENTVASVQLKPERLRITTISLQNGEKLSLNWSSNMGNSLDLSYELSFYKNEGKELLFTMTITPFDLRTQGWSANAENNSNLAAVQLKDKNGQDAGTWNFPLTFGDNKYSLVLDAMMSAKLQTILDSTADTAERLNLEKNYSTSITRLEKVDSSLSDAQDLYATVKAVPYAGTDKQIAKEYRSSEIVTSNTANSMYGDDSTMQSGENPANVNISAFRHLSNIRYFGEQKAEFTLTNKNMDWASVGTGVYDLAAESEDERALLQLTWKENSKTSTVDFPSVPLLAKEQTLMGKQNTVQISNLQMGKDSVVDDKTAESRGAEKTKYLGLFCELEGTAKDFIIQDAHVIFTADNVQAGTDTQAEEDAQEIQVQSTDSAEENRTYADLRGVGILAGRCSGTLSNLSITKTAADKEDTMQVSLKGTRAAGTGAGSTKIAGIGSFAGILARENEDGTLAAPESGTISGLSVEGTVVGTLPETTAYGTADTAEEDAAVITGADAYAYGIGGLFGYAKLENGASKVKLDNCTNHAKVSGNAFTGGIVGKLDGAYQQVQSGSGSEEVKKEDANIQDSSNDGMILCTADAAAGTFEGRYFGGIVGYGEQALVYGAKSASGRAENFTYEKAKQNLLKGIYVGGVMGYGQSVLLSNCETEKNGYILGSDYVGGIAGGLGGKINEAIRTAGEVAVTTNRSYVIGNSYVGGIVGKNVDNVVLKSCINNGVAAGYGKYAGGIVGYNDNAEILDCASYLSDYDSSIFNMIVKTWGATGDYVGGIAGYNNGTINFTDESQKITVRSVSSIVVGNNYIGGIAGFNDVDGTLDVSYTLIGGRIYAYEDCAGGAFGFNASEKALKKGLTIKPQSVQGRYYVGGIIGANVVDLADDLVMSGFTTDNSLGKVTGEAFCGGLIGYQRTYTAAQVGLGGTSGTTMRKKVEAMQNGSDTGKLLPGLDENEVPGTVVSSTNTHQLTISGGDDSLKNNTSNIALQAGYYAGGIVGYCEKNSKLVLKNCKNAGNISMLDEQKKDGVSLGTFMDVEIPGVPNRSNMSDEAKSVKLHFVGGILGVNLENQIIDHCTNVGNLSGYTGIGGIVGVNAGLVTDCSLTENFGNAGLSYLGGIAGINIGNNTNQNLTYAGGSNGSITYTAGTIAKSSTLKNKTVSGKSDIGGIAGWNLSGGVLKENTANANVNASGDAAGGIAGRNSGTILAGSDVTGKNAVTRSVTAKNGSGVGGIAGVNERDGNIEITGTPSGTGNEIVAVGSGMSVTGKEKVGGIVGSNLGTLGTSSGTGTTVKYLTCQAKSVRASKGTAGGIAGESAGNIRYAVNRTTDVTAEEGPAGGITALVSQGYKIESCTNYGNVSSSDGYAGGIAAENNGIILNCKVEGGSGTSKTTIYSKGTDEIGAICADNRGTIENSVPGSNVALEGEAKIFGGITGINAGVVQKASMTNMPTIKSTKGQLTVGGAVGENRKSVVNVNVNVDFASFNHYQYFGGVAGTNGTSKNAAASVKNSSYTGNIEEKGGAAGNCYGGIAGINWGTLEGDTLGKITMTVQGVYTATSTSTTEQKEKLATHAGGITGKNETSAKIISCTIEDNVNSQIKADYGMLGGVAGFNKGSISLSGSAMTGDIMASADTDTVDELSKKAADKGLKKDSTYVAYSNNAQIENLTYSETKTKVSDGRMGMYLSSNGNLGGITAYNATSGTLEKCVSGNWFLNNKSSAIGVGTGGIIGMNESEKDMSDLVNGAFVGRQISSGDTNRFAGGIIGNQNNATDSNWTLEKCINYGTVYCYNSHYSGGIMGQWTGTGGTIKECLNYGNMQTTYGSGWIGASGGIVAQLYHAYEENEYNIVSCTNYGSMYTQNGTDYTNAKGGANDSAGILGNVTNYLAKEQEEGQRYTIQILDCANGPSVEIYSTSMASGIFGFLSSDGTVNVSQSDAEKNIKNSTSNVTIRVERCRNFAKILKGTNYTTGIFGDRYGMDGWKNTIVKDNYGMRLNKQSYATGSETKNGSNGYPIFAYGNNGKDRNEFSSNDILAENRTGNFYSDVSEETSNEQHYWVYTNVKIGEGKESVGQGGSGLAGNGTEASGLNSRGIMYTFVMYDITAKKYFVASIDPAFKSDGNSSAYPSQGGSPYAVGGTIRSIVKGDKQYIDEYGYIRQDVGDQSYKTGKVLFYLDEKKWFDEEKTEKGDAYFYNTVVTQPDNVFFTQARTMWKAQEGTKDDFSQMLSPKSAEVQIADGRVTVQITPQTLPGTPVDGNRQEELCDPFAYEVRITSGNQTVTRKLYSEEGSFSIPESITGTPTIEIRSVSMYDDVKPSDWYTVEEANINRVLPDPDVRIELKKNSDGYYYEFSLTNLDEYNAADENGEEKYPNWQVNIQVSRAGSLTLRKAKPTGNMTVSDGSNQIYQMIAQATISGGSGMVAQDSKKVSTPICLPNYHPPISLNSSTKKIEVTGTTLENLEIKVTVNSGSQSADTPPIYRVELVGDWKNEQEVVFAKEDLLTVSKGSASVTFRNLPEYLGQAKNLKIRMWYASSGLGPVYTYHEVADANEEYNIKEITGVETVATGVKETWSYLWTILEPTDKVEMEYYKYWSNNLLTWLDAPKLENVGTTLTPEMSEDGHLNYTFQWDKDKPSTEDRNYQVELTGIDSSNREVRIDLGDAYKEGSNSLTVDGSEWNYTSVRLKVTRVGTSTGTGTPKIGLSSEGTYSVKPRLEQPGQISLVNTDVNELNYQFSWSAIASEEGCTGYQPYIQVYDENDKLGDAEKLGDIVPAGTDIDGIYQNTYNLEDYAGQRIVLYLVAKADEHGSYLDSREGVTTEIEIPARLKEPNVTWNTNWMYDTANSVTASQFQNGGLKVEVTAKDNDSIPPGGSAYLLKAYIYETKDAADAAGNNPGDALLTYPSADGTPVQMDVITSSRYSHQLEGLPLKYAGKWIVFYTRISSGGGNVSSKWTRSDAYRLPVVKLAAPSIASDAKEYELTVTETTNPDIPGSEETWHSLQNILTWNGVESADFYSISLKGNVINAQGIKEPMTAAIRVQENGDQIRVQQQVERINPQTQKAELVWEDVAESQESIEDGNPNVHTYSLDSYSTTVRNNYASANGITITYSLKLEAALTVEKQEDGTFIYTLRLPDAVSMTAKDGTVVTNSAFTITNNASVTADVKANQNGQTSDAFRASDAAEVKWNN